LIPTHEQAHAGLRAMKTVLTVAEPLAPVRREALAAIQKHLHRTDYDIDALPTITPVELASAMTDPALRAQLVSGMVTIAMTSEKVDARELAEIDAFAAALSVHPVAVEQMRKLTQERFVALKIDVARRGLAGTAMKQLYEDEGFLGIAK